MFSAVLPPPMQFLPSTTGISMSRTRSKSVAQSIASDVAAHSQDCLRLVSESVELRNIHKPVLADSVLIDPANRPRARSVPYANSNEIGMYINMNRTVLDECSMIQIPLYPFSAGEEEALLRNYLDNINYNSVFDSMCTDDIDNCADDAILSFSSECDSNVSYLRLLLDEGTAVTNKLSALTAHYNTVMKETDDFAYHSAHLLDKQRVLEQKAAEVSAVILVFEPLDSISATLLSSGNNIIRTGRIEPLLAHLQQYLDFLALHQDFKDAETYSIRYRQCMTRGLTLVMNYLIDGFRTKYADLSSRLNAKPALNTLNALNLDIIMYSEFNNDLQRQNETTKVPYLVGLIAERCTAHEEYLGLLSDILLLYFRVRTLVITAQQLMLPQKEEVQSSVQRCQRLTAAYKRLVEKEVALFSRYFPTQSYPAVVLKHVIQQLYAFLRETFEPFYDDMRNKILRETSISELCQLTNLLSSYYEFDEQTSMISPQNEPGINYGEIFESIMADVQARLIFRVQNYVDNKLLKYKTKPEDLLLANRKRPSLVETHAALEGEFAENLFPELYYPVGIALSILSQLYQLVSPMVFDDMAHYIVHSCILMLKTGGLKMAISHFGAVDARLFYLKNLLLLNRQLGSFEIQFVRTETSLDFTSGLLELLGILRQGSLYVNLNSKGGFLELVKKSAPRVINDMLDAKKEIDMELSNTVNEIVTECANIICAPILANDSRSPKEKCVSLNDNILTKVPQLRELFRIFISESEVETFLFQQLSALMFRTYETFYNRLEEDLARLSEAETLNEISEPEALGLFFNETVASLCEKGDDVVFDESILNDLDFNDNVSIIQTVKPPKAGLEEDNKLGTMEKEPCGLDQEETVLEAPN